MKRSSWSLMKELGAVNLGGARLFRIIFMVTSRCPLRCATCNIWDRGDVDPDPSFNDIESFFSRNRFSWINLTGGEIFLRDDMEEIFRVLGETQKTLRFLSFPTSGFLPERTLAGVRSALAAGIQSIHVTVSFDGGRRSHDKLRGSDKAFDRAARTFNALRELATQSGGRLKAIPGMTLSNRLLNESVDPGGDLVRDLELGGLNEIHLNLAHRSPHYYGNDGLEPVDPDEAIALIDRIITARKGNWSALNLMELLYLKGARKYLKGEKFPLGCKACTASVFIDAQWNIFPCTIFNRTAGNLKNHDFDLSAVEETKPFQAARSDSVEGKCPGCWTPCEAFTSLAGSLLKPGFYRLLFS